MVKKICDSRSQTILRIRLRSIFGPAPLCIRTCGRVWKSVEGDMVEPRLH